MMNPNRQRRQRKQAVAVHNVPDARTKQYPDLFDPRFTDPPLIPHGTNQASQVALKIQQYLAAMNGGRTDVELVICSPLRRCLQTASLAFPPQQKTSGAAATTSPPVMPAEPSDPGKRRPRMLLNELVREACGSHYPDKRRDRCDIAAEFPWVQLPEDFAVDPYWRPDARESQAHLTGRIVAFFQWLASNVREELVGIVSHGVWIETCLMHFCPEVLENGKKRVYNCDSFKADCVSTWEQPGGGNEWKLVSVGLEKCELVGQAT